MYRSNYNKGVDYLLAKGKTWDLSNKVHIYSNSTKNKGGDVIQSLHLWSLYGDHKGQTSTKKC